MSIDLNKKEIDKLEDLKTENRILRKILDEVPCSVYWKNQDGVYLGRNSYSMEKMKDVNLELANSTQGSVIGKTDYDFFSKEVADAYRQNDLDVMQKECEIITEETVVLSNGEKLVQLSSKKPLRDEQGKIIGVVGSTLDVTALKLAEEREELALTQATKEKIKAEAEEELRQAVMILTGSIVHDLRTPICTLAIIGRTLKKYMPIFLKTYEMAKKAELSIDKINPLHLDTLNTTNGDIEVIAKEMNEFINTTLKALSKTLAGELGNKDFILCSMNKCIDLTLRRYPFTKKEREVIECTCKYDFKFMGNEILMIRILSNLIKNSLYQIDKRNEGKIFITTEDGYNINILKIKDTAGGAPSSVIEHLFEGYNTTKKEGTGVGLAFCKKMMQDFGGDINCYSDYGNYIEFVLTFPKLSA